MQRVLSFPVIAALAAVLSLSFLVACGGGGTTSSVVASIVLSPTTVSLNEGAVATLSAVAKDASGNVIAADISFTSSNTAIATISSGGFICGGQWDASFINCNFTNGTTGVGTATITATSSNITATTTVFVHERIDQVQAIVNNNCTTMGQVVSLTGLAFSTSAPGCSTMSPCNITSTVGPFAFGSNDTTIAIPNTDGSISAGIPGATTIFGNVSGVNSVGVPYLTCPVATILVHNATGSQTSFFLGTGGTQPVTADVYDINSRYIKPNLTWASSSTATATVAATGSVNNPGTITAVVPGTAYITASCSYPDCNKFVPAQYSQNVVTVSVSGSTGTTVYAASTNSKMLVPFNISTNVPGTAITLPNFPNSIIADPSGLAVYLGSASGLMAVNVSTGSVSTFPANGTILGISANGGFMLISDTVGNALNYFSVTTGTVATSVPATTAAFTAYTPDSKFNEWINGTQLGVGLQNALSGTQTLSYTANGLDISAQGGLTYITGAMAHEIDVLSTCNQSEDQVLTANAPTLIKAIPNGTGAVAADSPNIDIVTTPSTLSAGCPVTTQSSVAAFDLGAGSFTPQQLLMSPDSSRVWVISDLPQILNFNLASLTPTSIALAGSPTPYMGGITLDGAHVYVGTSDNTVHRVDTSASADVAQIAVNLTDANGSVTAPNLVVVLP